MINVDCDKPIVVSGREVIMVAMIELPVSVPRTAVSGQIGLSDSSCALVVPSPSDLLNCESYWLISENISESRGVSGHCYGHPLTKIPDSESHGSRVGFRTTAWQISRVDPDIHYQVVVYISAGSGTQTMQSVGPGLVGVD